MAKKYQVFISGTFRDLHDERKQVAETILKMGHIPAGMEWFSSSDQKSWDIIKKTIDQSDFYLLILANRYGSTIKDRKQEISYTQKEYRYAVKKKIPVMAFLIDNDKAKVRAEDVDRENLDKLNSFIEEVKQKQVDWYENCNDLAGKVTSALNKAIDKESVDHKRPGWIRYVESDAKLNWDEYFSYVGNLYETIKTWRSEGFNFDCIVGISGGGLAVADYLVRELVLRIPVYSLYGYRNEIKVAYFDLPASEPYNDSTIHLLKESQCKKVLLVDSMTRYGKTIFEAKNYLLKRLDLDEVRTAVIYADSKLHKAVLKNLDYIGDVRKLGKEKRLSILNK